MTQKEIFDLFEQAGWEPMLCDTPVPCYDNEVRAGLPTMTGDINRDDDMMMPRELVGLETVYYVRVKGDSMKDAGILPGDRVQLCRDGVYEDGDIIVASIDGELTMKTYYKDQHGQRWLVPFNEDYAPIPLDEGMDLNIMGRVDALMRNTPRRPHAEVERVMRHAQENGMVPATPACDPLRIIAEVAGDVTCKRQWYAVYRALVDLNLVEYEMYATFVDMLYDAVPTHPHLPDVQTLRRMAVQSFGKAVCRWSAQDAPVSGVRYEEYLRIARKVMNRGNGKTER